MFSLVIFFSLGVFANSQKLIEKNIDSLTNYTTSEYNKSCVVLSEGTCIRDIAKYKLSEEGVGEVEVWVETNTNSFSKDKFKESYLTFVNSSSYNFGYTFKEEDWNRIVYYIFMGEKKIDVLDLKFGWYNGKDIVIIIIRDWYEEVAREEVLEGLLDAYLKKYPSELIGGDICIDRNGKVCEGAGGCQDSDSAENDYLGGMNYFQKGKILGNFNEKSNFEGEDYCVYYNPATGNDEKVNSCENSSENYCGVREYYCAGQENIGLTVNTCPFGCDDGACLKASPNEETKTVKIPITEIKIPGEVNKEVSDKVSEYVCNGCALENTCYQFGFRKTRNYCSDEKIFAEQKESDSLCENSFECESNVCVSGKCVSGNLLQKIIDWFKKLFGAE